MRSRSIVALCSVVALAAGAGGSSAQGRADTRPGLAVFPIWNGGSYGQDKENFDALQKGMGAMIISELAANPGARVVEREELQRLLEEQKLGQKDKAVERYSRALEVLPQYAEASEGLQRLKAS